MTDDILNALADEFAGRGDGLFGITGIVGLLQDDFFAVDWPLALMSIMVLVPRRAVAVRRKQRIVQSGAQ